MSLAPPLFRGLLEATSMRSGGGVVDMLHQVAASICGVLGYRTVVINLYRPAWHDYEVVVVHGDDAARAALLHTTRTAEQFGPLLDPVHARGDAFFIPHGAYDWERDGGESHVPAFKPIEHPDAWLPEDALLVPLRSSEGEMQGMVSVDEPASGMRPSREDMDMLIAVCAQAAVALESERRAQEALHLRTAAEHLLRVSAHLTRDTQVEDMLELVCAGVSEALEFDKVMVCLVRGEPARLVPAASSGWSAEELAALPRLAPTDIEPLLRSELEQEGCLLLDRATAESLAPDVVHSAYSSWANGRGPHAWLHHWLIVPLRDASGHLLGFVWADDPRDRLRPGREKLQILRTFANQVTGALESRRRTERLRDLSECDPLTGLRNRRGLRERLDALIAAHDDVGVVICDVDGFKRVNDELGYERGDAVLASLAERLRAACPPGGLAVRLGGEDFALVLPGAGARATLRAAERLRRDIPVAMTMMPWPLTLSAGVAVSSDAGEDAASLLRAGTRALFAAKRLGRDRTVVYNPEALDALLGTLEDSGGEQLAAMLLLADTLDLRDPHTARHSRTVGAHAEQLARALGWPLERVERIRVAGILHDIGKLGLPDAVLYKPGPLDDGERREIKRHPEIGARSLEHATLRDVSSWVLCHHERVDGRGYPRGLAGEDIPIEARVLAVADAFEAMTADRPYRRALTRDQAIGELRRHRARQFDAEVVDAFLAVLVRDPRA